MKVGAARICGLRVEGTVRTAALRMDFAKQKPKLSPDRDPTRLELNPSEGFLLSRIDGNTPWEALIHIGGMPAAQADRCLRRWLADGLLVVDGDDAAKRTLEAETDLTRAEQARVVEFEQRLDRSYHEILGVERNADAKAIKRAYFALSKEFHPDRHFRRDLGSFGDRLERIFRRIAEAYELLSDPMTRAEIERSMPEGPPPAPREPEAGVVETVVQSMSTKRAALERLRQHFRIPEKVLAERRFKAKQFAQASNVSARKGKWMEAAASIRLAIAFDPWNGEYKRDFAEVQAEVNQLRAADLLEAAQSSLDGRAQQDALRLYEEALGFRPGDAEINAKAARLALELGEQDAALEYAEAAAALDPKNADAHALHGRVLARAGMRDKAREALSRALELDPGHEAAIGQMESLKRSGRGRPQRRG